ncbi:hypothetical protein EBB07_18020 [Paenibacillaceae bacterium]|nr:hypothetical protein EBB07_18020 [Paenibacillaceae bacterium]
MKVCYIDCVTLNDTFEFKVLYVIYYDNQQVIEMSTTGAIVINRKNGEQRIFGFKTSDSPVTGFWHGQVNRPDGYDTLAYGLTPQQGINAGLNSQGLMMISSYFDYVEPNTFEFGSEQAKDSFVFPSWSGDIRGIIQAKALGECTIAAEANALLEDAFMGSAAIGGNHLVVDKNGGLFVFEHCRGRIGLQDATLQGYAARSNQSLLMFHEEQGRISASARLDRKLRQQQAERQLASLKREEAELDDAEVIARLQTLVAGHVGQGGEPGSICAHGIRSGRSNSSNPHQTLSAMIWQVNDKVMHYTVGHPCSSSWKKMRIA